MKAATGPTVVPAEAEHVSDSQPVVQDLNAHRASPRTGTYTLERREIFDSLAHGRDRFKARRWYYYKQLTAFIQFSVPPGQ